MVNCLVLNSASPIRDLYYCLVVFEVLSGFQTLLILEEYIMSESQSKFVHWQNLEYEAWYEITGPKTQIVPGSFHTRPNSKDEDPNAHIASNNAGGEWQKL